MASFISKPFKYVYLYFLGATKESIRKEACWTISNITAGNREQIQAVIGIQIILKFVTIIATVIVAVDICIKKIISRPSGLGADGSGRERSVPARGLTSAGAGKVRTL